jgi:hypothetical protein
MVGAFSILAGIAIALCLLVLIVYIMYDTLKAPFRFVFIGGSGREYKLEIKAFTVRLQGRLPGRIQRIEATPSHIYYLLPNIDIGAFKEDKWEELTIAVQREVQIYPAQKGVWISVHYHYEVEETYKPYLNQWPNP